MTTSSEEETMTVTAPARFDVPRCVAEPDFNDLLAVLRREAPSRPTLFEFFLNDELHARLVGHPNEDATAVGRLRWVMEAFRNAGYCYVTTHGSEFAFPAGEVKHKSTKSLNDGAVITDRASYDRYVWRNPDEFDYSRLEDIAPHLIGGMRVIAYGPGGVLENVIKLVGFESLCFMLMDDPDLAREIFDAVGSRLVRYYEICAGYASVGACISNDDWGFKSQPMLSPEQLRTYVFPWHKRIVATIHAEGKPAILHSCGNAASIMDDIIDAIGFDGKHSYEDSIQPVERTYDQYHSRIAILGGIDVDFVCRSSPEDVYRRARAMLERSAEQGSYGLGTGNSVPYYVPHENYFAMIHAAL
jgi:uroporphyrinogen decarboxylase